MPPPAPPRRRTRLLTTLTAVVVLAGGGVASYVALSDTSSEHGAASPREAVENIVSDINDSDVIGMLDSLAPPERVAIADPLIKDFDELKRTHILSPDADLSHLYTIADSAATDAGMPTPTAKDAIPADGAGTPVDAVKKLVTALLGGDVIGAIEVLSPSEMAALHDYGSAIPPYSAAPITLDRLELHSKPGPDGSQLVYLDGFSAQGPDGQISLEIDGNCV